MVSTYNINHRCPIIANFSCSSIFRFKSSIFNIFIWHRTTSVRASINIFLYSAEDLKKRQQYYTCSALVLHLKNAIQVRNNGDRSLISLLTGFCSNGRPTRGRRRWRDRSCRRHRRRFRCGASRLRRNRPWQCSPYGRREVCTYNRW